MKNLLPRLNKGDAIGAWTASDPIIGTEASEWVKRGINFFENMGFPVIKGQTLKTKTHYTAGAAEYRWNDFLQLIQNQKIKMILTALGGENAHQILPLIDFKLIARHPKIIMGYSDPTVFLNPISSLSNIPVFYGPHLASFDPHWSWFGDYDGDCFDRIFFKNENPFEVPPAEPRESWKGGTSEGALVGGSLTDLIKLLATPWEPSWDGSILILETMNQTSQNIDVYFTHLFQAGVFHRISGLILGKFYNCGDEKLLKNIIMNVLSQFHFPVLKTEDFGHFSHFCPFPLGSKCRLDADKKTIHFLDRLFC